MSDPLGCLDTLRASDSVETVLKVSVDSQDSAVKLPPEFQELFAESLRAHFKAPDKLTLSVVTGWQPCDSLGFRCVGGVLNLSAVVYLQAHGDGTLSDVGVVDETITPTLAASVTTALTAVSRARQVPWIGHADSLALTIRVAPGEQIDTVHAARRLFRTRVPRYNVPFSSATMPAAGVSATYPIDGRLAGIGDSVTLAFTVRADGTIAAQTMDLVSANYREFVASVYNALARTRYHPAHLGDCAVATRMKQRFVFKAPQ